MNPMGTTSTPSTVQDAINLYHRLLERGQKATLARLSVEARCQHLQPQQRKLIYRTLREIEATRI